MIVQKMLEQAGLVKEKGKWKSRVGLYEIHLTGRDGESEPRTIKGSTMVQLFHTSWIEVEDKNNDVTRFPRLVRIMRYSGYDLHEGIALAKWMVSAAYLPDLDAFTRLRLSAMGYSITGATV